MGRLAVSEEGYQAVMEQGHQSHILLPRMVDSNQTGLTWFSWVCCLAHGGRLFTPVLAGKGGTGGKGGR